MDYIKYDKYMIDLFIMPGSNRIRLRLYNIFKSNKYSNIKSYLLNRYNDSLSYQETIFRILYNIEKRPVCKVCGKPVNYIGKPKSKGLFAGYCCAACKAKATNNIVNNMNIEKTMQTKLEKYGSAGYNNRTKSIQTNIKKYGSANNINKIQETKQQIYGDKNYSNTLKAKQTKLERYGNEIYVNAEKAKQTKLERYGDENYNNINQIQQTCLEKYGYKTPLLNDNIKEKIKQTNIQKYGEDNPLKVKLIKHKIEQTCLEKYGVKHCSQLPIVKNKIVKTKRKNRTFNTSQPEEETYELLKSKYTDVIRQYKSDLYPFCCDFYIPSLNLYIEYNGSWTHGGHPYNILTDYIILEEWKNKATTSDYYKNAIETWTKRDVKKREIAKQNQLNYIEFWNINEVKKWLNTL